MGFATREELADLGANTLVNPVNCAYGKTDPTTAEQQAYESAGVESCFEFIHFLGEIFYVGDEAAALVRQLRADIEQVKAAVSGVEPVKGLVAFPGMAMINANGLPGAMTGGIYDDLLRLAGVENTFATLMPNSLRP